MAVNFQQQLFKWNHAAEFPQVLLDVQHKPQQTSYIHNVFVDLFKKISLASFVCSMFAADINFKNKINTKECLKLMWSLHVVASCSDDFRFFLWLNLKQHLRARRPASLLDDLFVSLQKNSRPKLFPGDIVEYPRNKFFSHFAIYYGERDGVPYVAHLTCRGRCFTSSDPDILCFRNKFNVTSTVDE